MSSFVIGLFYSDDIYKKYDFSFNDISNTDFEMPYLYFLRKCFACQLVYNTVYEDNYKRWRYYKLLTSNVLIDLGDYSDTDVLCEMRENDHFEMMMSFG